MTKKIVVTGIGASSPLGGTAPDSWTALLAGESGTHTLDARLGRQVRAAGHVRRRGQGAPRRGARAPGDQAPRPVGAVRAHLGPRGVGGCRSPRGRPRAARRRLRHRHRRPLDPARRLGHPPREGSAPRPADDRADAHAERRIRRRQHGASTPARSRAPSSRRARRAPSRSPTPTSTCSSGSPTSSSPAAPSRASTRSPSRRSRRCRRCRGATTTRPPHPGPTTSTATASSWARAPRPSSSRPRSTRRLAAPRSTPRSPAAASPATRTTSPLPTPRVAAPRAPCYAALEQAGATVDDVTHINAHATSTPVGDIAEYKALLAVFGDRVHEIPVSATKAAHGHLLGGTGALEAIFTILAVQRPDRSADDQHREPRPRDPAERRARRRSSSATEPQLAISNSFGFGGHNAVVGVRARSSGTAPARACAARAARTTGACAPRAGRDGAAASSTRRRPPDPDDVLRMTLTMAYPTLCSQTTGLSSLARRKGSSSSSQA